MPLDELPPQTATSDTTSHDEIAHVVPQGGAAPVKVQVGKYGELEAHELVHLLDSIDTERERARFRESLYLSVFVWILVAWFVFYGPRFLWHQPKLRMPADVLRERELTNLTLPRLPPAPTSAPRGERPAAKPALDAKTMEALRKLAARQPAPAPSPATPQPAAPAVQPSGPPPPPPPVASRVPSAPVPDAPAAQPTKPNFGQTTSNAGDAIRNAVNGAAHDRGGAVSGGRSGRGGPLSMGGVQVLSDTQGVDFGPYLKKILADIRRNWEPLIPVEAQSPLYKQGEAYIRFAILPDGSIGAMSLDDSTHDTAINRSCWGSITSEGQFPPLPAQFHGPNLELRIHYLVNKGQPE